MELGILERILIPGLLPNEGKYEDLIVKDDILKKMTLTQKELSDYEVKENNGSITWNAKGVKYKKEIEFTTLESDLIKKCLKKLNDEEKLTDQTKELYKLFVINN